MLPISAPHEVLKMIKILDQQLPKGYISHWSMQKFSKTCFFNFVQTSASLICSVQYMYGGQLTVGNMHPRGKRYAQVKSLGVTLLDNTFRIFGVLNDRAQNLKIKKSTHIQFRYHMKKLADFSESCASSSSFVQVENWFQ